MSQGLTTTGDAFQAILEGPPTLEAARALHQEHKKRRIPKIKTEFRIFFKIDQGVPEDSWITELKRRTEYQIITTVAKLLGIEQFDKEKPEFTINGTFEHFMKSDVLCVITRIHMRQPYAHQLENILSEQKLYLNWSPSDDETYMEQEAQVDFLTDLHDVVITDLEDWDSEKSFAFLLQTVNLQAISIRRINRIHYDQMESFQDKKWEIKVRSTEPNFITKELKDQLAPFGLTIAYRRRQQRQRQLASVKYPAKAQTYATALTKGSPRKVTQSKNATYLDALHNFKDVIVQSSEEPNIQSGNAQVASTKDQPAQAVLVTSSQLKEALQSNVQPQEERQHQLLEEQTLNQPPICLPEQQEAPPQKNRDNVKIHNSTIIPQTNQNENQDEENRSGPSSPEKRKRLEH
jgi:hypothetical protein